MSSAADDADTERARSYRRHQTWALALGAAFGPGRGRCPAPGQSFLIALFLDDLLVGTGLSRMAALETHEIVHSRDLANDGRWPVWGPKAAAEAGVGSVVSYRLFTTTDTLGAMNLYSCVTGRFTTDEIYNGQALAAHVAVALAEARHAENLERAVTTRTVIGQAEGILMERFNITAEQAFNVLRRVSQDRNVKLNVIAE